MKKNLHPTTRLVNFSCSSCKKDFKQILSTIKVENVQIEICSNCHPFYLGKSTAGRISGKAEKLVQKFEKGKANLSAKPTASPTKKPSKTSKKVQNLQDLAKIME